jgi:hypothetical protein
MGTAAKPTRENRTITVDFRDGATYFCLIKNGKAFVEFVLVLMKWTRLFSERLRRAKMVVVCSTTMHHRKASPMAQQMTVLGIDIAK